MICLKTQIYIHITCWVYDQTHNFKSKYTQIYTQIVRKVPSRKWYLCMLHNHFIGLHPIKLKKERKGNTYKERPKLTLVKVIKKNDMSIKSIIENMVLNRIE